MTADAKTPRDVLAEWADETPDDWEPDYEMADSIIAALTAAGYQITPAVRDDGARIEAAARAVYERNAGPLSLYWDRLKEEYRDVLRSSARIALAAADAVAGAGRDGDAVDAVDAALIEYHDVLGSCFRAMQRDATHDTIGTTNYRLLANRIEKALNDHRKVVAALTPTTEPGA